MSGLPVRDLWADYIALGGNRTRAALVEYLAGTTAWRASEHNTLAQALNEDLWGHGHPSLAPYRELPGDRNSVASDVEKGLPRSTRGGASRATTRADSAEYVPRSRVWATAAARGAFAPCGEPRPAGVA